MKSSHLKNKRISLDKLKEEDRLKVVRYKQSKDSGDALFSLWEEQKKMQAEDQKLKSELDKAKKRAKDLRKTLRKHQLGETNEKFITYTKRTKTRIKPVIEKLKGIFWYNKKSKLYTGAALSLLVLVGMAYTVFGENSSTGTLGDVTSKNGASQDLPRETPKFALLFPQGSNEDQFDVVRISPPGTEPSFTYLDKFTEDGLVFRVTQQELPKDFDIVKTATEFQATNIIQVDSVIVYHGYSEKGGVQSLLFEKDQKLISIRSPQKFNDDTWATYVSALK